MKPPEVEISPYVPAADRVALAAAVERIARKCAAAGSIERCEPLEGVGSPFSFVIWCHAPSVEKSWPYFRLRVMVLGVAALADAHEQCRRLRSGDFNRLWVSPAPVARHAVTLTSCAGCPL